MATLQFTPNPTFILPLRVPVAGSLEDGEISLTVKYHMKSEIDEMLKGDAEFSVFAVAFAQKTVKGWDLQEAFNNDNLLKLFEHYPSTPVLLFEAYFKEYWKASEKN